MTVEVGLCSITLRGMAAEDVISVAERAGIRGIEWGSDVHVPPGDLAKASATARRCRDAGIAISSYGSYLGMAPAEPGTASEVDRVLDTAESLGTELVRAWTEFGVVDNSPAVDRERVANQTAAIADAAARRDMAVALEFHPGTLTHTAASTNALLDQLDRPNLRTHWQPDPTQSSAESLDQLKAVLPRLAHLHVFTWGQAGITDRRPLADGAQLWPAALELAAETEPGWSGTRYALCEYVRDDDPDQLIDDASTLRRWLDAFSQ